MPEQLSVYENVLVPTDGSRAARRAAEQAISLVKECGGTIHALYVLDMSDAEAADSSSSVGDIWGRLEEKGVRLVTAIEELATEAGVRCAVEVRTGTLEDEICEYARDEGVDLIVMGRRGRSDPDEPLIGSTTRRVMDESGVPVRSV